MLAHAPGEPGRRFPRRTRISDLLKSRNWTWDHLAAASGVPVARLGAVVNGPTGDPHLLATRLNLPILAVLTVLAAPPGAPCTLPLALVVAIHDGAPPTRAEEQAVAAALALTVATLNDDTCPRCDTTSALVFSCVCWLCGWRIHFQGTARPPMLEGGA